MRHCYFRLFIGIVWLIGAIVSGLSGAFTFAGLYILVGIVFLYSAYSIWKKEKEDKR